MPEAQWLGVQNDVPVNAMLLLHHLAAQLSRRPAHAGGEGKQGKPKAEKMTAAEAVIEKHREKAKRAREQEDKWLGVQNNMAVYVTGLPDDTTEAELAQVCCTLQLSCRPPPRSIHCHP